MGACLRSVVTKVRRTVDVPIFCSQPLYPQEEEDADEVEVSVK